MEPSVTLNIYTKMLTCSPAHLLTCSPAHLLTCSPAHLLTCSPAHLLTCSPAHLLTCSPAHLLTCSHTPSWRSRIFSRTPVSWVRNQCPPIFSVLKTYFSRTSFSDVFFPFRWLSMLSSHLSIGLPLALFPFIFNFITTLSVEYSPLLMTWPNHRSLFLSSLSCRGLCLIQWWLPGPIPPLKV